MTHTEQKHFQYSSRQIWGRLAQDRGTAHEQRVLWLLNRNTNGCIEFGSGTMFEFPDWYTGYEQTNPGEHYDLIIHTRDVGAIFVEIKSSTKGKENYARKHGPIADKRVILIVRGTQSDWDVLTTLFSTVLSLRNTFLKQRATDW